MIRKKSSGHGGHGGHGGHRNNRGRKFRGGGGGGGGNGGGHYDSQSLARQKKHAMTQKDKYMAMARDAQVNGDRVNAEYYYQHVEHYSRTIAEIEEKEPQPQPRERHQHQSDAEGDQGDASANDAADDDGMAAQEAEVSAPEVSEIPLPSGLFGADDADRAANS